MTIVASVPPEAASRHFDPVLRPDLAGLYAKRAARLRDLAQGHDLAEYLRFAARVAEAQGRVLDLLADGLETDPAAVVASGPWPEALARMIDLLRDDAPESVQPHLAVLATLPEADLRRAGMALTEGRFGDVAAAQAPLLWAALSVAVADAARRCPLPPRADEEPVDCPVCGCAPVASLIHTGDRQGLRYLHCALCDCEWHMVRAKCSNCEDAGHLDYLSFDTALATVRAEACTSCGSYLKVISHERDQEAEVVADDLATLVLDDAAALEGFARSGFNPFALPAEDGAPALVSAEPDRV